MGRRYIDQLRDGDNLDDVYLVTDKQLRANRNGNLYLLLELRDRRARILHVEDDESLTQLVEELLSDEAEVVPAHSLAQAQASIEAQRFDLVILANQVFGFGFGLHRWRRRRFGRQRSWLRDLARCRDT